MTKEKIQEEQYSFPYHYLTEFENGGFSLSKKLQWGLMHASYLEFIVNELSRQPIKNLLDAGSGDGRLVFELEKIMPETSFTGIDISERALFFAKGFTKKSIFLVHDIIKQPTNVKFDFCTSIEVIEHIPPDQIPAYVRNIHDSLTDSGKLLITTPTTNLPTSRKHYQHFTKESMENILTKYFIIEDIKFLNHENYFSTLLSRILTNKFFTINHPKLKKSIYNLYKRIYLNASEKTGSRIYIVAIKK